MPEMPTSRMVFQGDILARVLQQHNESHHLCHVQQRVQKGFHPHTKMPMPSTSKVFPVGRHFKSDYH